MPLIHGSSDEAIAYNIRKLKKEGKTLAEARAIALSIASAVNKAKRKKKRHVVRHKG